MAKRANTEWGLPPAQPREQLRLKQVRVDIELPDIGLTSTSWSNSRARELKQVLFIISGLKTA
jgi:hypothetical protein